MISGALLLIMLLASANAHMWLRVPLSRGGVNNIGGTSGPCNGLNSGGTVSTYEVGQKVTFQFRVNQHGPNPFNFALLDANNNPITLTGADALPSGIPNTVTAGPDGFQGVNVPVTIPNHICSNCAIQLSGMGQTSGTGTWYQCASIAIVAAGSLNQPQPSAVSPNTAPTTGGVKATLTGIGFGATSQTVYCRFGTVVVTGTWVNSSEITCNVPPSNNPSSISVEASTDGKVFSATGTVFTYTGSTLVPVITSISPDTGVAGDNITITGQNFYSQAVQCKFNTTVVQAIVVSSTEAICTVPDKLSPASTISISVNSDNSPYSTAVSFKVGGAAPLGMAVGTIVGIVVGVAFFGVVIGVVIFLVATKKITFGASTTPAGWQRTV